MTTTTVKPNGQHLSDEEVANLPAAQEAVVATLTNPVEMAGGEVDVQVTTARRFPRDIARAMRQMETMATMSDDIAASCFYKLKRGGKDIEGPSVRLAEVVANGWTNLRVAAQTVREDDRFVYCQGTAWDLETNVAIRVDVRRRITGKNGQRYSDDMIAVTANAGAAICLRNVVFRVVPKVVWEPIYEKAKRVAVGDAKTLGERREKMIAFFTDKHGVAPEKVFGYLGVDGLESINLKHVEDLRGLATALKEGDVRLDEAFPDLTKGNQTSMGSEIDRLTETLPDATKTAVIVGFDALNLTPAQRLTLLRQFTGKPAELEAAIAARVRDQQPAAENGQ